ncbi:MAG: PAS domain S-box protein [Terracidiphilus sp.]
MENTDDFIFFKDRNHVFTRASRNFSVPIGPDRESLNVLGLTDYDLFPEKYADIFYRLEKQVFAGIPVASELHESLKPDGTLAWLDNHKYPIMDENGEIVGLFGVSRDMTEHMKAQQALRENEESLKESQRIAGLGSYTGDLATGDWISSAAFDQMFGVDKEYPRTLEGWAAMIHPDDRAMMVAYMENEILGRKKDFDKEYRIVRISDGAVRWVHDQGRLEFDGLGRPVKMNGSVRDVTEHRQAEQALRDSEESLREAQSIAGLGSYVTDIFSGTWTSSEVLDGLFGIGKDYERTVEGWGALVHPDDRAGMVAYFLDEVIGRRRPFDREYRIVRHSDGAVRWVHGLGRLDFSAEGRPAKMTGTIKDITERKQIEIALRESEESLREAQKIAGIGSFIADLSTGVARRSEVLLELFGIDKDYDPSIAGWLALIHPDDQERIAEHLTSQASGIGSPFTVEFRVIRPSDQAIRWMQAQGRLEFESLGKPTIFRGAVQDITERKQAEVALRESKELLQLFITHAPAGLAMFDRDMRYLAASRRWMEMHALLDREVIGHSHYEVFPELPVNLKEEHHRALSGEALPLVERSMQRADGSLAWIRREVIPWRTGDGDIGGIIIFSDDITRQRKNEERVRLAASVFTNAREGITITDPAGTILEVNDMFTRITGYSREEAIGNNTRLLKSGVQNEEFYDNMWRRLLEEGQWSGEIWNRNKNGEIFAETLTINAVRDASGNLLHYVSMFSDVTQLKEHEQQLEHVANFDVLTSLPNRTLLADRLRQAMTVPTREDRLIAVAYLDLDGFKGINDRFGHDVGDRLLTSLAFNMKCALRKGDTLARLGGDEFVAVMLDLDDVGASVPVLNRLLEAASELVQVGDLSLNVTASVGVAFYRQKDDVDADLLLRQADQAMYQAKLAGGHRYHIFDPERDQIVRGRHENLEHIRHAMAAHEFVLYYQPKVNMRTGRVVGAEALIRWQHPERGLLPPGLFLPVIEEHPLAVELGEWVIDTALSQIESWRTAGLEMPVSVNVGALQLQQPDFVDRLSALLALHPNVRASTLELEVLETSALQDVVQTSQVLNSCHNIGVSFALDDFGTGYSSLTYLKRLPASILKIDQSFVSDMLEDPENLNILEGILGLGSAFHRQVIAEGVETVEHGLMLLRLGCELAQGYGIARPMPARDLPGWVAAWRPDLRWAEVPPVHSGNRTLLYAFVEHRAWIAAFDSFLQGRRHTPPALDQCQCRFGAWLDAEGQAGRGQQLAYRSVDTTHRQFHTLAGAIVASQAQGSSAEGIGRLGELHRLGEDLLGQLETLMQWS